MKHTHAVVIKWNILKDNEQELGRFCSEQWAQTFAETARAWFKDKGSDAVGLKVEVVKL